MLRQSYLQELAVNRRIAAACVAALIPLASCSTSGDRPVSSSLPSRADLARYDWGGTALALGASRYPALGEDALRGRSLPHEQVVYASDGDGISTFVATLFQAEEPAEAERFWRRFRPARTYRDLISIEDRSVEERQQAEAVGGHRVRGTRPDERWSAVCFAPLQSFGDRTGCSDYFVWVQWCDRILELRVASSATFPYRSSAFDTTMRELVGDIRDDATC